MRLNGVEQNLDLTWIDYTPTLANITIGNGTITARRVVVGTVCHFSVQITVGSTTTFSGTLPTFTLPLAAANVNQSNITGIYLDASIPNRHTIVGTLESTTTVGMSAVGTDSLYAYLYPVRSSVPVASGAATGDKITISGTYETAT